jgi:hypothetical protein
MRVARFFLLKYFKNINFRLCKIKKLVKTQKIGTSDGHPTNKFPLAKRLTNFST